MRIWRLLDLEYASPYMNLAVEEAISRMVGEGSVTDTVRFWRNINAVIIGRFQNVECEVNLEACKKYNAAVVRRFTGGGAVYTDLGNLNYTFFIRKASLSALNVASCIQAFKLVRNCVIESLKHLNLYAEDDLTSIYLKGKKISGIAGCNKWGAVTIHGTLLVNSNINILSTVLNLNSIGEKGEIRGVRSVKKPVTTLRDELGSNIPISEVKNILKEEIEKTLKIKLVKGNLTIKEKAIATRLYKEKYSKDEWNLKGEFRRSTQSL